MLLDPSKLPSISDTGVLTEPISPAMTANSDHIDMVVSTGLCDLQVNGFAGVDYNNPRLTTSAFEHSLTAMLATGVTRCLPTVITADENWQSDCFRALESACRDSKLAQQMVVGYHLEGPYLNPQPGYCGCHPAAAMIPAHWDHFQRMQEAAGDRIRLVTVAPEVEGVLALIPRWVEQGITVAIGHSAANRDTLRQAAEAGACLSTHLGNGIASVLPKRDNPILCQLAEDRFSASFIADGYHQERHVLGVYLRAKQSARTILVTDGTAGSAAAAGHYTLGQVELERQQKAVVTIPGTENLAGSATTLAECVRNVVQWYATPLAEAVTWASENPRKLIGLSERPQLGNDAEWVWWRVGKSGPHVEKVQLGTWTIDS